MCQIELSLLFAHLESFLIGKPGAPTVSLSYENLLPRLTFTCFCFVCGTVPHVFVAIANVVDSLNHIFFLPGECHPLFNVWTATHDLQFSSGTVPLNFV